MNTFDKICAAPAFLIGVAFLVLGVLGLFVGCKAHFALPPILGALPALVGWGIVKPIVVSWRAEPRWRSAALVCPRCARPTTAFLPGHVQCARCGTQFEVFEPSPEL